MLFEGDNVIQGMPYVICHSYNIKTIMKESTNLQQGFI